MILEARLGLVDFKRRVRVLATDIHTGVLCTAERGRYPENALRSVPEAWKGKYFERSSDGAAQVAAALRAACMFRRLNLHSRPYPMRGRFDTVFCRNVLYYFDPLERIEILKAIHEVVQPNGWLVTSVTEPIGRITGLWHEVAPGVYSRISPAH
jgi:chemotaxis protein methyltransferase CheR